MQINLLSIANFSQDKYKRHEKKKENYFYLGFPEPLCLLLRKQNR